MRWVSIRPNGDRSQWWQQAGRCVSASPVIAYAVVACACTDRTAVGVSPGGEWRDDGDVGNWRGAFLDPGSDRRHAGRSPAPTGTAGWNRGPRQAGVLQPNRLLQGSD